MNLIDWREVATRYDLSPDELTSQVLIAGCVLADMYLADGEAEVFEFSCNQPDHKLVMDIRRRPSGEPE